jgi:tRNA nucleotidyltransferase/poly(A) polymerase
LIKSAIKDKLPSLLSPVRRRHEFELVLKEADSLACLELMSQWNLLPFIHKGAVLTDAHRAQIKSAVDYMERLTVWLSGLGSDKAKKILDELEFERATKSALLARLAIS